MHQGQAYHEFMLASPRDAKARRNFQEFVQSHAPVRGTILDYGAGTGIDAKAYAALGLKVLVYEPAEENRAYLADHCREELDSGAIAATDITAVSRVDAITANFAVINLIADPTSLFAQFERLLQPRGRMILSLLNPFFLGDARYRWWRANLRKLLQAGSYAVAGKDGSIYRFTPSFIVSAALPAFRLVALSPRGVRLCTHQYMFMAFQKN